MRKIFTAFAQSESTDKISADNTPFSIKVYPFRGSYLGYQIPFYKKSDRPQTKGKVFHHHKDWWKG